MIVSTTCSKSLSCIPAQTTTPTNSRFTNIPLTTWMGGCLRTGKPSRSITNYQGTKVNSAFQPSGVGKLSAGLHGWG